jgi:hypothetical protein
MPFLDFIRNRNASRQQQVAQNTQERKPETARQMYARQGAQETAKLTPLDRLPAEQKAKVDAIKATLEKATQHIGQSVGTPSVSAPDTAGDREAMRQKMAAQDKAAPALTPTGMEAGRTAHDQSRTPANAPTPKAPEKASPRPQTVPRPRPSWQR